MNSKVITLVQRKLLHYPSVNTKTMVYFLIAGYIFFEAIVNTLYIPGCRYFYGVIGMEAFHDFAIPLNTPSADHFLYDCGLGFVNLRCSVYMIFQLLTTSNWHDIMNTVRTYQLAIAKCIEVTSYSILAPALI